jgi:competence protein ComEA
MIAAAAALAGAALGMAQRPASMPVPSVPDSTVAVESTLEIHVAGWVTAPGVVVLPEDAIVADAVAAAGGLRLGARADLINLAAPLRAGDQVVVPGPSSEEAVSAPGDGPVSINQATAVELQALPGVGPVLAERIVAHREQIGGFDQIEDLLQVPGIGESKLAAIRDLVRVP